MAEGAVLRAAEKRGGRSYAPLLWTAPALLFLLFFWGYPSLYTLYLSLTDTAMGKGSGSFTGLANYVAGWVGSFIGHGDTENQVNNALSIFGGIAITAAIAGVVMWLLAGRLVDWMHGAEGAAAHPDTDDEIGVTGAHEAMPEKRPAG